MRKKVSESQFHTPAWQMWKKGNRMQRTCREEPFSDKLGIFFVKDRRKKNPKYLLPLFDKKVTGKLLTLLCLDCIESMPLSGRRRRRQHMPSLKGGHFSVHKGKVKLTLYHAEEKTVFPPARPLVLWRSLTFDIDSINDVYCCCWPPEKFASCIVFFFNTEMTLYQ